MDEYRLRTKHLLKLYDGWVIVKIYCIISNIVLFYYNRWSWSDSINSLKKERIKMRRNLKQIRFILCESCFWCASCLNLGIKVDQCPICNNHKVQLMPVSDNELDTSNLNPKKDEVVSQFETNELKSYGLP